MEVLYRVIPNKIIFWKKLQCKTLVGLTFDDGPDPKVTPLILDALDQIDARATFFVTGDNVKKYPYLLTQIVEKGHEVASHGFTHKSMIDLSIEELKYEIKENDKVLKQNNIRSNLFRPPYGHIKYIYLPVLFFLKKTIVMWNLDCKDYMATSSQQIVKSFEEKGVTGGDILLFHDTSAVTPKAIIEVGKITQSRNCKMVTISELLKVN